MGSTVARLAVARVGPWPVGGLFIFRERLLPLQVGGAILILAGPVLLGLGS
jgi:hypothetical protein